MTGDDDDDGRPNQTKPNADRMDYAIRDDLAALVIPRKLNLWSIATAPQANSR
jgi:hypothetical protein